MVGMGANEDGRPKTMDEGLIGSKSRERDEENVGLTRCPRERGALLALLLQ